MKKLPTGRQNFKAIIQEDLLYIDKTHQIYELISSGSLYFLSRPRRFGKSLLISTLRYLFEGRKDLFQHLYIGQQTNYSWQTYPVLQFNFAAFGHQVENLEQLLSSKLQEYAQEYKVELINISVATQFQSLVKQLAGRGQPVVILIDEYDKPIVDFLIDVPKAKANQKILRQFFGILKDLDAIGYIRFLFITGVSKFSKVSLFSDLNNLTDLTTHPLSNDLLGITHKELLANFQPYIKIAAEKFEMPLDEILYGIKLWYNGYSFDGQTFLYNPFSILNFFGAYYFGNFWFATGTPTFLVETIRDRKLDPKSLENKKVDTTFFDKFTLEELEMSGLLFQTGYLTIKKTTRRRFETFYHLNYPNVEVKKSFFNNLIQAYTFKGVTIVSNALIRMREGLEDGDVSIFIEQLKVLLSDISYHLFPNRYKVPKANEFKVWEGYFQTIIYLITSFMEIYVRTEVSKHKGRLDLLAETEDKLYIMEFKLDKPAKDAIQQIKARQYATTYRNSPKPIYLVGIGFSKEKRNVENWKVEIWDRK